MDRFALVNWASVFIAALSGFIIGGLWYGPLFGRAWLRATGLSKEAGARVGAPVLVAGAYLLNLVAAAGIALQNGAHTGWLFAAHVGLMGAVFFIAPALGVIYLFEQRTLRHWLVNAGYQVVNFTAMGAVIGLWPR